MTEKGTDLFRYKGILNIMGEERKYVFQGVHMLFGASLAEPWTSDENKENRAIFIGKNLDREYITKGFEDCKA
jgi:G3E family GTPase